MSIQSFVYDFKNELKSKQINLKTTHLYELIAAAFGYKSYGSLKLKTLPLYVHSLEQAFAVELLLKRCSELELDEIITKLFIEKFKNFNFIYKTKEELTNLIRQELDNDEFENSQIFEQLKTSFEIYPDESIYPYLIAQFYSDCEYNFFEDDSDMNYLYQRYLQGKEISPTWKPDLDHFIQAKVRNDYLKDNYINYLSSASALGSFPAEQQLYEFISDFYYENDEFDENPDNYKQHVSRTTNMELELAKRGNEEALRNIFERVMSVVLEESEEYSNILKDECLLEAWKWQKFALFIGFDLAKGNYRAYAIDEYGNDYDDDIGGPIFVAESGRKDIHLPQLSLIQDEVVQQEVEKLIAFHRSLDEFVFDRYAHNSSYVWSEDDWDDEEY